MTHISTEELRQLCHEALNKAGLNPEDTKIATDHYLENEMSGKASHGILRVVQAAKTFQKNGAPQKKAQIEKDTGNFVIIDAQRQIATAAIFNAIDTAVKRTKKHGIVLIGIRNTSVSSGSLAYYLRRLVKHNLVALMGCNSDALVAPPAGKDRVIGTNPFGIGIPGENGEAFIADFSTAAIAYGKIRLAQDKGEEIPKNVLIDKNGRPSNKPEDAYNGAILPLAEYAGFSLGLMIELLAGPLINAKAHKLDWNDNDGCFMILINAETLGQSQVLKKFSESFKYIENSTPRPGHDHVPLPGARSDSILKKNQKENRVDVASKTLEDLKALAT